MRRETFPQERPNSPVPSSYAAGVGFGDPLTLSAASSTMAKGSGMPSQACVRTRESTRSLAQFEWRNRPRRSASWPACRRSFTSPAAASNTPGRPTPLCQFAWCHPVSGCDDANQSPSAWPDHVSRCPSAWCDHVSRCPLACCEHLGQSAWLHLVPHCDDMEAFSGARGSAWERLEPNCLRIHEDDHDDDVVDIFLN